MNVAIVFGPSLDPDPLDHAGKPRRLGEFLPDGADKLVIWRELGDEFEGGSRTHVVGDGAWSYLADDQIVEALSAIDGFIDS